MKQSQNRNGKAFEYALADALGRGIGCKIVDDESFRHAQGMYASIDTGKTKERRLKGRIDSGAGNVAGFILSKDRKLKHARSIRIQGSKFGQSGDVRDIVVHCRDGDVGFSAKHNHYAIKHSRLSHKIDFGKEWGGHAVSADYWSRVRPIFAGMEKQRRAGKLFRDIPNKSSTLYLPVLTAFEDELQRLCEEHSRRFIEPVFRYLIGRQDYYKVICRARESIIIPVNMGGTLTWGAKWKIPTRIEQIKRKPRTESTLLVSFAGGWQISFRLHNATSKVEPSLKFDIQFVGMSSNVTQHHISH